MTRERLDGLRPEPIVDLEDPRVADYRNLKDAALLRRRDRFVVEGRTNLLVLLAESPYRPESILLGEAAFEALRAPLERHAPDVPLFVAPQRLLEAVVGFPVHRGALAVCRRPPPCRAEELVRSVRAGFDAPRILVVEDVRDADNVGALFRNALALGGRAIFLSEGCCDPLYRKAVRTSMGASLRLPFARIGDLVGFLDGLRESGFAVLAFDPKEPGEGLDAVCEGLPDPVALVVGTEGPGLSAAALGAATRRVRIAMEPGVDSLNVATAAAIGLFALRRAARVGGGRGSGGGRGVSEQGALEHGALGQGALEQGAAERGVSGEGAPGARACEESGTR